MATETPSRAWFERFELSRTWRHRLIYAYLGLVFLFVLAPVAYTLPAALQANFNALTQQQYISGILNSFQLGFVVAIVATLLATIAARYYRYVAHKNMYIVFMTLPLFIPGDTHAISVAVFAKQLDISLSFLTLVAGHVFYVFPFGFLMVLATMAGLPQNIVNAAEDLGATPFKAFVDIELPLVLDGVISAFLVSFLLSINESARASTLGGKFDTISGIILSYYGSVGLNATLFALNIFLVVFAIVVILVILLIVVFRS